MEFELKIEVVTRNQILSIRARCYKKKKPPFLQSAVEEHGFTDHPTQLEKGEAA